MEVIYSNASKMQAATAILNLRLKAIKNAEVLEDKTTNKRPRTEEKDKEPDVLIGLGFQQIHTQDYFME
mgnify:CR=1 FL=1